MKKKYLIVVANYYKDISNLLLKSALKEIKLKNSVKIFYVPGVFEIPVVISKNLNKFDGFIALGCVIKGQTPHFEFISNAVTNSILKLSIDNKKPIGNGIITCLNRSQAKRRGFKGSEAANAMLSVLSK
tara:strand:- start:799 stop:1185 length:387 start_codon:yes stop_codon:yes gene_type:complete